jgi:acetyl-CoA synthetase
MTTAPAAISSQATRAFREARDFLLQHRDDYATAYANFQWPKLQRFNWALDWFDAIATGDAAGRRRSGLRMKIDTPAS